MDLFALALDIRTTGAAEAKTALAAVEAQGIKAGAGLNGLGREMAQAASKAIGLGSGIGQVAGSLTGLASGGLITVGFLAGAALIKAGFDAITAGAREAKEKTDQLIDSLNKAAQARFNASVQGKEAQVLAAMFALDRAEEKAASVGGRTFFNRNLFDQVQKELEAARIAYNEAESELQETKDKNAPKTTTTRGGRSSSPAARVNQEQQAADMLRDIRAKALQDALRAAGQEDQADFARIDAEAQRRRDEISQLKVSEQTKADLLLALEEETGNARQELDRKIWERIRKQRDEQAKKDIDAQKKHAEEEKAVAQRLANELADTIISAAENALSELFQGHGLTASLKALGKGILSGIGSILVMIGKQVIAASAIVQAAVAALLSLNPFAALAAGIALVALGSAIGGAGGGGGAGASSGYSSGYASRTEDITRYKFVNRDGSIVNNLTPKTPYHFTIIGPNDPQAQRTFTQLADNANRRKS